MNWLCLTVDLSVAVVDKDVPCAVVFQVGDLQAAGVANLGRLEGGIEGLNFHHRFGIPCLGRGGGIHNKQDINRTTTNRILNIIKLSCVIALTSCLLKYFSAPSLSDRMNFRLKNWPLSLPRFHRNPSLYPGQKHREIEERGKKEVCVCVWLGGWYQKPIRSDEQLNWGGICSGNVVVTGWCKAILQLSRNQRSFEIAFRRGARRRGERERQTDKRCHRRPHTERFYCLCTKEHPSM